MSALIYLDNAATTKVSEKALQAMLPFYNEIYGNPSSLYTFGQQAKDYLESAREMIAKCLNAKAREIYFTSGGSESDNWALLAAAQIGVRENKRHIVSTAFEHHAILHTLKKLEKQGFEVTYLPVNDDGVIKISDLKKAIRQDTCLVSVMFANNEIGTIQPIAEIGKICREQKVLFHTDAVQAVGHVKIDVESMNIDMLSLSSHKFHGPKGVGALYVRTGVALSNLIEGGAQERGRRAGTENLPAIYGMAVALQEAVTEMDKVKEKEILLRNRLFNELTKIPHSAINGSCKTRLANNFNMCFEGIEGESLLLLLDDAGICASSGSACTSGALDPSHVLLAIGRPHEVAHGSLRLTLSKNTTDAEIDYVIKKVTEIVAYLRNMSPVWDQLKKGVRKHVL